MPVCFPIVQSSLYGRVSIAFLPVVAFSQRSRFWFPSGQSSCVPVHPGCQHNPFDLSVSLLCLFLSIFLSVHMNAWSLSSILYRLSPAETDSGIYVWNRGGMVFVNAGELQGLSMQ